MKGRVAAVGIALTVLGTGAGGAHAAATAASGAAVTPFATGFPFDAERGLGPIGLAMGPEGSVFVSARDRLYRFSAAGGDASAGRLPVASGGDLLTGITFDRAGRIYGARYTRPGAGDVVELDPQSGGPVRSVATGIRCPTALATDPISGDLFVSTVGCGRSILRIHDGVASTYVGDLSVDGITFAPDGTLYIAHEPDASGATISSVAGTNASQPGARTPIASVPHADGVALGRRAAGESAPPFLVVNRTDGFVTRVDLPSGTTRDLMTGGSRGDLVAVGDDGCLYATQTESVLKLTNAGGGCTGDAGAPPQQAALSSGLVATGVPVTRLATPRCPRTRKIPVSVRFRGKRLKKAVIRVNGKRVKTVRGRALRRTARIARLPAKAFTVTVTGTTRSNRKVVRRIRYSGCGRAKLAVPKRAKAKRR